MPLKIDLHVHTCYSGDSNITLKSLLAEVKRKHLDGVAITDHDTIEGALEACKVVSDAGLERPPIIIPGIEVSTKRGHIIGLNVTESIPMGLSMEETIEGIHEAGGIAVAAHPQSLFKGGIDLSPKILSLGFDAIEVINSSLFPFKLSVQACKKFAEDYNLPQTAGSDSHIVEAIGLAYTLINTEERSVDSIVGSIKRGLTTPIGAGMPFALRIKSIFRRKGRMLAFEDRNPL
ncbi:MAG: CehA/McbA family metallohydrolase [Candidatus Bathyarchaeia archaeon]